MQKRQYYFVVTETKQKKDSSEEGGPQDKYKPSEKKGPQDESSEEENSTGSELPVIQVKMSNLFDTKLEYLLTNYYLMRLQALSTKWSPLLLFTLYFSSKDSDG